MSTGARRVWAALRPPETRLLERAEAEREVAVNRLVAGVLVLCYVAVLATFGSHSVPLTALSIAYIAAGAGVFVDVVRRPHRSPRRRYACLCLDLGAISLALSQLAPQTLLLLAAYTWTILGYSFRYGIEYSRAAALLSLIGWALVVAATPYYRAHPFLAAAVAIGLAVVPAYLEALLRKALGALERERDANRATAYVLACISHDLRAPLGALTEVADELGDTVLGPRQRAMLAVLRASARSVLADIDHLVDVSRIEADHLAVARAEFALLPLLHEVVGLADAAARAKGGRIALHVAADTPLAIETDRRHLGKILLNLVHASVEAGAAEGVLVTVDGGVSGRGQRRLRVAVTDAGAVPHAAAKVLDPSSKPDAGGLRHHRTAGLGLSAAKHLVGLLGGRIGVENGPDGGTTYRVEIPVQVPPLPRPDLAGTGVVLLSREPARVRPLAARMERLGAATFVVGRGEAVADVFVRAPDGLRALAVVVDGRGVDAVASARVLREDPVYESVPLVLFASGRGLPRAHVRRCFATAVDETSSDGELCAALRIVGPPDPPDTDEGDVMPVLSHTDGAGVPPGAAPPRALVVDASRTGRVLLAQWLTRAGYDVRAVASGDAALDALAAGAFDVALVDLDGPETGGLDAVLLHRFTELGAGGRLPVVGLAAGAEAERDRAGPALDAWLAKPLDRARLLEVVGGFARARSPSPPGDDAAAAPGVASISSHPRFRAGLGPPPAGEFDHLAAGAGAGDVERIAGAFREDADAVLGRLEAAAGAGDAAGFRARLEVLRATAVAISAARVETLCRSGAGIEADALPDRGKALVAQLAREVRRVCGDLEGRC